MILRFGLMRFLCCESVLGAIKKGIKIFRIKALCLILVKRGAVFFKLRSESVLVRQSQQATCS